MPREIRSSEQFEALIPKSSECRVVRNGDEVKLKLRTPDYLYVYKTNEEEADNLLKNMKDVEVLEITRRTAEKEKKSSTTKAAEKEPEKEEET